MANRYNFSPINSLWFVPLDQSQNPSYHYTHLGHDLAKYRREPYAPDVPYYQPVQSRDWITIQYEENNSATPTLALYDQDGKQVTVSFPSPTQVAIPGNLDPNGFQIYTNQWTFTIYSLISSDEGIYTIKLSSGAALTREFISEPIDVRVDHPDTLLFSCTHSRNEYDTIFTGSLTPRFAFRVPGIIKSAMPDSEDTVFDDQQKDPVLLSATPYRTSRLLIGGEYGVADWVLEKLNWYLSCDTVKVDAILFTKEDDSKFEIRTVDNGYPLYGAEVTLRDYPESPYSFASDRSALLTIPSYPFFIRYLNMSNGVWLVSVAVNAAIHDASDLAALVSDLNSTTVITYNLQGSFSVSGGVLYYDNADNELYYATSQQILTDYFTVTLDVQNTAEDVGLSAANGVIGLDYEVNSVSYAPPSGIANYYHKPFSTTGTKTLYVFHNNAVTSIGFTLNNTNKVTDITGSLPTGLQVFMVENQDIESLSPSLIYPTKASLMVLWIKDSAFEGFDATFFTNIPSGPYFPNLLVIDFRNNALSDTYIDAWIDDQFVDHAYPPSGFLYLEGQTPSAPPNTSASGYVGLQAAGWTISND